MKGITRKFADCVFVLINIILLNIYVFALRQSTVNQVKTKLFRVINYR